MAGNYPTDYRAVFEHYLYDYLKKNNMHETAEIFRNEANLAINQIVPPGVDVEDGFLREWWHIFYDVYEERHPVTAQYNEGSSSVANETINVGYQSDPFSLNEHQLNEQMIKELTVGSDIGIIIDGNLVPSGSPSIKNERVSEDSTSAGSQEEESMPSALTGLLDDMLAQRPVAIASDEGGDGIPEIESILLNMFYVEEDPDESGAKIDNCVDSKDEGKGIKLVSYSSSEASSPNSDGCNARTVEESERKM